MLSIDADEFTDEEGDESSRELKKIERRFKSFQGPILKSNNEVALKHETVETLSVEPARNLEQDYDDGSEDSLQDVRQSDVIKKKAKLLKRPDAKFGLPRSYFTDGPTPWSNFHDMVLGQRFLNARLSPIPQHSRRFLEQATWNEPQLQIVTELMKEANSLLEMFDQVAMLLGPDVKLHDVSGLCRRVFIFLFV